jgi:hypothetical protein
MFFLLFECQDTKFLSTGTAALRSKFSLFSFNHFSHFCHSRSFCFSIFYCSQTSTANLKSASGLLANTILPCAVFRLEEVLGGEFLAVPR